MSFKRELFKYNPQTQQMESVYCEDSSAELHYIQTDEIAPVVHPVDGKVYTSARKVREVTRSAGLIEAGNENIRAMKTEEKRVTAAQIAEAAHYAREHLRDPRNLRAYREAERDRRGELRFKGLIDE